MPMTVLKLMLMLFLTYFIIEILSRVLFKKIRNFKRFSTGIEICDYIAAQISVNNRIANKSKHFFEPRPYGLYWNSPNFCNNGFKQTDEHGFRFKGYDVKLNKELFRVLVYGGSTTFSDHFIHDPAQSWPYLVENLVNDSSSQKIEVINAGLNWATSAELLSHFVFEGKTFSPDLLIIEGPGNDSLPISNGDKTPDYRETRAAVSWQVRKYESFLVNHFAILKILYVFWLRDHDLLKLEPSNAPNQNIQNQLLLETYPTVYEKNINTFVEIALQMKIKVVLVDFLASYFVVNDGKKAIYSRMNKVLEGIAHKYPNDVYHYGLTLDDFEKKDFADPGHLNGKGELKKAKIIFNRLNSDKLLRVVK
jgi:hypothetical protein